ncbi:MAG: efflux RND transporter periplasmic adaptor subunit [Candidatus Krumholzibacteriota bacterium]|nr:efflux RND transporter periplasmic adaptor subunit [Candidatus Krumholzibacteriota bacterium]
MGVTKRLGDLRRSRPRLFQFLISIVIIAVGAFIVVVLMATKTEVIKRKSSIPVPVVNTLRIEPAARRIVLTGEGTVRPLRIINLVPQVSGKIVSLDDRFADGGEFARGEQLLKIEDTDYRLAVKSAESKVMDLESRLQMAIEEAAAAREEWAMSNNGEEKPPPLVAKEPQLAASRAALSAAEAEYERAMLNLERTSITAPFEGRISAKNADIGQFVSPGQVLATIYSIEAAEITVPMKNDDLSWFSVPGFTTENDPGSCATVIAEIAGMELQWPAMVMRAEGFLDSRTRMVNVVVRVDKPYQSTPPLAMGLFTSVRIEGNLLENTTVIPRSSVHEDNTVWLVDPDGRLRFRRVEIARFEGNDAWITSGLSAGELVVTSAVKAVTDSMKVNLRPVKGKDGK